MTDPRARTAPGRLIGKRDGATAVLHGVPFASPPVGDLRRRPPWPAARWDGERRTYGFGPAPPQPQPQPPTDSIMYRTNGADRRPLVISEDCP
ncbi:carboxylesterase family protein [Streptomyces heilongjiangensis]|uniref:Carboxylesterase family protein n=1 Tax=Streptomyces heilongjiangensis TaxID=945052 RepID=A0ABW1BB63_9ACTN|nr:carboxylesterase family protein [Streptomyces heilongjiangensis]MDC2950532.1 carboxylesterase family protein [Streptomyces heilongjiangensis]